MNRLLLAMAAAFAFWYAMLLAGVAHADEWSKTDTYREATFQVLWLTDSLQTHTVVMNPHRFQELNHYLGPHPTMGAVNRYFMVGSVIHAGIAYLLPADLRHVFQYVSIGTEGLTVASNFNIGITARF